MLGQNLVRLFSGPNLLRAEFAFRICVPDTFPWNIPIYWHLAIYGYASRTCPRCILVYDASIRPIYASSTIWSNPPILFCSRRKKGSSIRRWKFCLENWTISNTSSIKYYRKLVTGYTFGRRRGNDRIPRSYSRQKLKWRISQSMKDIKLGW